MNASFSSRIAVYFGALFLLSMGALFVLWYFGLPQFNLDGARNQRLVAAMRELELRADARHSMIQREFAEARGDTLVLTENPVLARRLEKPDPALQADFQRLCASWQRAYPDRYRQLMIVNPGNSRIVAASTSEDVGRTFQEPALIKRAMQPGITELVEQLDAAAGLSIAIVRQVPAASGNGKLAGILVALVNPQHFVTEDLDDDLSVSKRQGTSLIFDAAGRPLASSAIGKAEGTPFKPDAKVAAGFEGTLLGREQLVVYRHLEVVGSNGWRLVYYRDREEALAGLQESANKLIIAGLLLALVALVFVSLAARRVARPLRSLAEAARELGAGHLAARASARARESREIATLADAFNGMAENLQKDHETLEARILERTAELQRSETRHRTLFESTADAVLIIAEHRIIDCNPAAVRMFGASRREEILGKHPAALSPEVQSNGEDSYVVADRQVATVLQQGAYHFEWLHRRLDTGESFFTEIALSRLEIDGQPLVQATVRDITVRKRAEEQLARQNSLLKTLVENFPGGISLCDAELRVVALNSQFKTLLDLPDELMDREGLMFEDVVRYNARRGEYGAGDVEEIVAAAMARARKFEAHQFERIRPDGRALEIRGAPLPGGGFVTFYIDITERKLAEKALQESEELFRAVAQSANDAIVTADSSGVIIKWNKGAECIFGYSEAEAIGQPLTLLMPQRFHQAHSAGMKRVGAGGQPHVMGKPVELTGRRKDGSEFPLELSLAQWAIPEGHFFTGVIRDITERKKIEQQLANQKEHLEELVQKRTVELSEALEAARQADQTKDAFLANMSHELRTPLNAVIGMAGLARDVATEPGQRAYLDKIVSSGVHLNRIINDLLDLSKIAAGHMEFEVAAFRLDGLLERCHSVMEHRAAEKGLSLVVAIDSALPEVLLGDSHRVEQILLNLVGNAIKFTPRGRIDIRARLEERKEGRVCIDIEVQDTGIGMRPEDLKRLFKPFSQADATVSRQFGGTGLGLAISRRLAEMMDGDIRVSSREGSGTTFGVKLWLGEGTAADLPVHEPATEQALPAAYENVRVLVAEDQPLNREIVEALLGAVGIVPRMAENGREALDILGEEGAAAFDLVLMDIQMPLMDGLAATRELRRREGFDSLPVIAMTAHTMEHEKEISAAAGMNDHIGKPFDNASFYRTLARWIPLHKQKFDRGVENSTPLPAAVDETQLDSLRGVDVAAGLARFGGKEQRYRHWLHDFTANAPAIPETIRAEVAAGNRESAAKTAHAFKGRVGMLGMTELHGLFSALEAALREGQAATELLAELETAIGAMCMQLAPVLAVAAPAADIPPRLGKVVWKEEYSVGVADMDKQHQRLIEMINQLADCHADTDCAATAFKVLSDMFDYTQIHFKAEEAYLEKIGYPQLADHEREHQAFVEKMISFNLAGAGGALDIAAVHRYLKQWLLDHIVKSDRQYARFLAAGKPES